MSVYFMDGGTFLKHYVMEDPKIIKDTSVILVSSSIKRRRSDDNRIIMASNLLYPPTELLFDYNDFKTSQYENGYKGELDRNNALGFLATVLIYAIDNPKKPVVFLCSKKEKKFRYLKLIQEYVEDNLGYHIFNYKKYKEGKDKTINKKLDKVYSKCIKVIESMEKEKKRLKKQRERKCIGCSMKKTRIPIKNNNF